MMDNNSDGRWLEIERILFDESQLLYARGRAISKAMAFCCKLNTSLSIICGCEKETVRAQRCGAASSRATGYVALVNKKLQGSERIMNLEARTMLFGFVGPNVACVQVPSCIRLVFPAKTRLTLSHGCIDIPIVKAPAKLLEGF
uniref:Uncharacterized protein n=1 Tax=Peronospora matthiolae TaxID=2874970 RepID=A0AAV1U454_9STRA